MSENLARHRIDDFSQPEKFPPRETYTVADVSASTGVGRTKIYEEIATGRLISFKHCGRRLIRRRDLLAWLDASQRANVRV
jgi:excisionase family DNA binding protein